MPDLLNQGHFTNAAYRSRNGVLLTRRFSSSKLFRLHHHRNQPRDEQSRTTADLMMHFLFDQIQILRIRLESLLPVWWKPDSLRKCQKVPSFDRRAFSRSDISLLKSSRFWIGCKRSSVRRSAISSSVSKWPFSAAIARSSTDRVA